MNLNLSKQQYSFSSVEKQTLGRPLKRGRTKYFGDRVVLLAGRVFLGDTGRVGQGLTLRGCALIPSRGRGSAEGVYSATNKTTQCSHKHD